MRRKFRDGRFLTTEKISPLKEKLQRAICYAGTFRLAASDRLNIQRLRSACQISATQWVWRPEEQIFNPETIASFEAKPVVIGHARFADPDNWREIAVGTTQNVRRGEGDKSDFLLADLLLTDRKAIEAVESGI